MHAKSYILMTREGKFRTRTEHSRGERYHEGRTAAAKAEWDRAAGFSLHVLSDFTTVRRVLRKKEMTQGEKDEFSKPHVSKLPRFYAVAQKVWKNIIMTVHLPQPR